jgi:predicted nucleic acid-binding protein
MKEKGKEMKERFILDSFAFISFIKGEKGGKKVEDLFERAERGEVSLFLSKITETEIYYVIFKTIGAISADDIRKDIKKRKFPVEVISAIDTRVEKAGEIKAQYNLSFADAFVAQLALEKNAVVVTGDPEFKELEKDKILDILWL